MKNRRFVISSAAALAAGAVLAARRSHAATPSPDALPLSAEERALHALNRLGYGPRPADAAAIAALGADQWLERFLAEQLEPRRLPQPEALTARLAGMDVLKLGQAELLGRYRDAIPDWDRALADRSEANREEMRLGRAMSLARAGEHERADQEVKAEDLLPEVADLLLEHLSRLLHPWRLYHRIQ